jgi:hypothetical protein
MVILSRHPDNLTHAVIGFLTSVLSFVLYCWLLMLLLLVSRSIDPVAEANLLCRGLVSIH